MKLVIMSRREIEVAEFTEPCVAICVAYPSGRLHKVNACGNLLAVHHARFSDCDADGKWSFPDNKYGDSPFPMTRGQAIDILDFVEKWRGQVDAIYIACYGGISRSAGIGAGLAARYGWDDTHIYKTKHPNVHCKSLLMREEGLSEELSKEAFGSLCEVESEFHPGFRVVSDALTKHGVFCADGDDCCEMKIGKHCVVLVRDIIQALAWHRVQSNRGE